MRAVAASGLARAGCARVRSEPASREVLVNRLKFLLTRYRDEVVRVDRELAPQIVAVAEQLRQLSPERQLEEEA